MLRAYLGLALVLIGLAALYWRLARKLMAAVDEWERRRMVRRAREQDERDMHERVEARFYLPDRRPGMKRPHQL